MLECQFEGRAIRHIIDVIGDDFTKAQKSEFYPYEPTPHKSVDYRP
jgi:hypothetical protein